MGEFIYNNNNNNGKKWFFLKIIIIIFWLVWKDRGRLVWSLWSLDQQHGNWNVKGLGECAIRYKPIGKTAKEYLRCDINYVEWVLLIFFSSFYLNIFDVMLNGIMDIYIYIYIFFFLRSVEWILFVFQIAKLKKAMIKFIWMGH